MTLRTKADAIRMRLRNLPDIVQRVVHLLWGLDSRVMSSKSIARAQRSILSWFQDPTPKNNNIKILIAIMPNRYIIKLQFDFLRKELK